MNLRVFFIGLGMVFAFQAIPNGALAEKFKAIYTFHGTEDGNASNGPPYRDKSGNLFGTTMLGGTNGKGTVFEVGRDGRETVIHNFGTGSDGAYPSSGLIAAKGGKLVGTTQSGGTHNAGIVFSIAPNGTETVLYNFGGYPIDGAEPVAGLIIDKAGNLYGTTAQGGSDPNCGTGCGTVFELTSAGSESMLHSFSYGNGDGVGPAAGLLMDQAGNLYGTTAVGGSGNACVSGCGTVFEISSQGTESILYYFRGGGDGQEPFAGLIEDHKGNLYGTTQNGGGTGCGGSGCGTVFRLQPNGDEAILHAFKGGKDGEQPYYSGVISDKGGNLYGTTLLGGTSNAGTVFEVESNGKEKILHSLNGGQDGAAPASNPIMDGSGNLYGTASAGGTGGQGTVFTLRE
jgi:uncharacterized repeat protein (TIGR03803 family)